MVLTMASRRLVIILAGALMTPLTAPTSPRFMIPKIPVDEVSQADLPRPRWHDTQQELKKATPHTKIAKAVTVLPSPARHNEYRWNLMGVYCSKVPADHKQAKACKSYNFTQKLLSDAVPTGVLEQKLSEANHFKLHTNAELIRTGSGPKCSVSSANDCLCSKACKSLRYKCRPSSLCDAMSLMSPSRTNRTAIVISLVFHHSYVRKRFRSNTTGAFVREYHRVQHLLSSLKRVRTKLPIVVMVGGHRFPQVEEELGRRLRDRAAAAGGAVIVRPVPFVQPPRWASKWHRLSFQKLAAFHLAEYSSVIVLDNDMVALKNFDELEDVIGPAAVFHPSPKAATTEIVSGFLILRPSAQEFERAIRHLAFLNYTRARYDGGDEEFWTTFYENSSWLELPFKYHTRSQISVPNTSVWHDARLFHAISNFAPDARLLPRTVRDKLRFF